MSTSAAPDVGQVSVDVEQTIATICLDRPAKHNALTPEMLEQLGVPEHPIRELEVRTPGDQFALSASTRRAEETLGWKARVDLRTGLQAMIGWAGELDS